MTIISWCQMEELKMNNKRFLTSTLEDKDEGQISRIEKSNIINYKININFLLWLG